MNKKMIAIIIGIVFAVLVFLGLALSFVRTSFHYGTPTFRPKSG
jgi:hypothetical protein